ncbi:hypothetical protein N2152v2_003885 [Parachlorella kessleri]
MSLRALHYVLKVTDRTVTVGFLRDVLDMHPLRHEEFAEGCRAACNGPYDGKWSKTMIGYGSEDRNFVLELAYNYGVKHYQYGNGLGYIKILSKAAFKTAQESGVGRELDLNILEVKDPDGHTFRVINEEPSDAGPVSSLCLRVTSLEKAADFWCDCLGLLEVDKGSSPVPFITLSTGADQATLRLAQLPEGEEVTHGTGYGRVAFSCPTGQLGAIQEAAQAKGFTVLRPLVKLDTPGKATVEVVILADPDGHEVCFVGDEAFRELSQVDESAPQLLGKAIAQDNSKVWFEERSKRRKTDEAAPPAVPAAAAAGATTTPALPVTPPAAAAERPAGKDGSAAAPPPAKHATKPGSPHASPAKAAGAAAAKAGGGGTLAAAPAGPRASPSSLSAKPHKGGGKCTSS